MTTRSKILPNRLKEVRTQAGITQAELPARVGTHPSYISNVENYISHLLSKGENRLPPSYKLPSQTSGPNQKRSTLMPDETTVSPINEDGFDYRQTTNDCRRNTRLPCSWIQSKTQKSRI